MRENRPVQKILYSEATLTDLPEIVEMKLAMFKESGYVDLLSKNVIEIILEDYQRLYKTNEAKHFVAISNKIIIACVGAFLKTDLPYRYFAPPKYGFIGDVYSMPENRQCGISTKLNKTALAWLREQGVIMVRLLASDAGRPIYENLGFTSTDEMSITFTT